MGRWVHRAIRPSLLVIERTPELELENTLACWKYLVRGTRHRHRFRLQCDLICGQDRTIFARELGAAAGSVA